MESPRGRLPGFLSPRLDPLKNVSASHRIVGAGLAAVVLGAVGFFHRPSGLRSWAPEFAAPATFDFSPAGVKISALRDYAWDREGGAPRARNLFVPWDEVVESRLLVSPLSPGRRGPAHVMMDFRLRDGTGLVISAEARREIGESYSPWRGALGRYELIYVVATERDAVALRTIHGRAPVYQYRLRADPAAARALFRDMLERADALSRRPERYNTLFNNCAQNIRRHANRLVERPFGRSWRYLLPGYLDAEAASRGLLDLEGPLDRVREAHRMDLPVETGAAGGPA